MLYAFYEMTHAAVTPLRAVANATHKAWSSPFNPASYTLVGRQVAASAQLFEAVTRRYRKPEWDLPTTTMRGHSVAVEATPVWSSPFCNLVHFKKDPEARAEAVGDRLDPRVLIVAPMSGHYATLLRGTVEAFLPDHEVFITDWIDARQVPVSDGRFDLDDYVDHVRRMLQHLGPQTHVVAVCQPGPPVLAAVSLMADDNDPARPATMTFMGSPIDARQSPTVPNKLAEEKPLAWFKDKMIHTVPMPHPGFLRRVYPGFVQLAGFMRMNWNRHVDAHWTFFEHLVEGDGDSAEKHRSFYDEYLSVMDLTEEFYIQTIERVFQRHELPRGIMTFRGERPVRPDAITDVAVLTVEGENDDISGIGQTQAALDLCKNVPEPMRQDYIQPKVGHYGVFNGSRFRDEIRPRITKFIHQHWNKDADRDARRPVLRAVAAE